MRYLLCTLLCTTTLSAQSYLSQIIPKFESFTTPVLKAVAVARSDSAIQFKFQSADFSIVQSGELVQPLITVRNNGKVVDQELIDASPFFPDAECHVVSFDADHNGVDDLFISFPYGLTGLNSNVDVIAAFFFFPDSSLKFVNLRSYYGGLDLFRDYERDGRYEYACINEVWSGSVEYDAVNLFSLNQGVFANCTRSTPGFPIFVEKADSGPVVVKELPPSITADWYLKRPDVLANTTQASN